MVTDDDLERLNRQFETAPPGEILRWAVTTFWPDVAASVSFQTQGVPLLHLIAQIKPDLPIIFLDTGYHFPETLVFRDRLVREWGLNLRIARAVMSRVEFVRQYGDDLYRRDPDLCCALNKVEPMRRAMTGLRAWISGVRRDQTAARASLRIVERTREGVIRVHPIATWTSRDIARYLHEHNLPNHPLTSQGYLSVGCAPCTRPVHAGEGERAGRWAGRGKLECGLHTLLRGTAVDSLLEAGDSPQRADPA